MTSALTEKGRLIGASQSGQMFEDIFIISNHFRTFVWALYSEYASLPTVKRFCIDAILFELACAECFQYETYHAPLGSPFFSECSV